MSPWIRVFTAVLLAFALASCGVPPVPLDPLPKITLLEMRSAPAEQDLTTTVRIERQELSKRKLEDGVTAKRNYVVPDESRVVISVPVEEQRREERNRTNRPTSNGVGDEGVTSFKTTGYFNMAEQQIEKSLIGKNFLVQDRSKFEAKLRDLRSKVKGTANSEAKQAEIRAIGEKKDSGEITVDEWAQELAKIEKKYGKIVEQGSRRPGQQKELLDISELIRAAQEGEVQADYILQVNTFRTEQLSDRTIYLVDEPEIAALCSANPGLREQFARQGRQSITQPGFYGSLNAKLIEVQTGVIAWIGEHRVESLRVFENGYQIVVPIRKRVSNTAEIARAIDGHNEALKSRLRACEQARKKALGTVDPEQRNVFAKQYNKAAAALTTEAGKPAPSSTRAPWTHEYLIGDVSTRPLLPTADVQRALQASFRAATDADARRNLKQRELRYREFLTGHFSELVKMVAKELIQTIPSK